MENEDQLYQNKKVFYTKQIKTPTRRIKIVSEEIPWRRSVNHIGIHLNDKVTYKKL